jgi:hypothetical protein
LKLAFFSRLPKQKEWTTFACIGTSDRACVIDPERVAFAHTSDQSNKVVR